MTSSSIRKLAAGPSTLDLLAKARWKAPEKFPYLGKAIWSLSFIVTDAVPTMAVDKRFRVYVNPEHVRECIAESTDKNRIEVLLAGVIHEALHPTLRHAHRGEIVRAIDKEKWNHACFPAGTMLPCGTPIESVATMRRRFRGELVRVSSQTGDVSATPDHPFLVCKRVQIDSHRFKLADPAWLRAQDIEPKDFILVPRHDDAELRDDDSIDLRPYAKVGTDSLGRRTFGNRAVKQIPLTPDVAWLIGLWVAEGSACTGRENGYVQWSLGSHETALARRIADVVSQLGWSTHSSVLKSCLRTSVSSPVFGRWLREHCGRGAHNKHAPRCIMYHRDDTIRRAFIRGVIDGDGSYFRPRKSPKQWVCVGSVSRGLVADLALMLAQDGMGSTYSELRKGPRQIGKTWTDKPLHLHRLSWCLTGASISERVSRHGKRFTCTNHRWRTSHDGVWVPVKRVSRVPFRGNVFNMTTSSGTYVANGMLVHNCDVELVQHIQRAGIHLWSKDITPENQGWPRGLTAEEYYKLPEKGQGGGQKKTLCVCCSGGSGATGVKAPWELPDGAPGPKGLSEPEAIVVRAAVAEAIRQHAKSHGRGSVPDGLLRWAEEMMDVTPIDWSLLATAKVRYYIETRLGPVASYARPSRRAAGGLILPVHRSPRANVIIVGDTSGSMGDSDIGKIIGVTYSAIESLGTIKALGCDSAAVEPVEVRHIEDLREALRGGGGTDMSVGIAKAAEHSPDVIVVVTDGDTPWPDAEPECPVVVVLTAQPPHPVPAWADVIDCTDGGLDETDEDDDSGDLSDEEDDDE